MNLKDKIINRKHKFLKDFFNKELSKDEKQYLINKFNSYNIHELCYRELNNILEIPKCKYCGNDITFQNFSKGYMTTCKNTQCQYKNRKEKMFEHYGVENPYQLDYVKEKCKQKHLEKYGVDNPSKAEEIKKKKKETCLKHYGVTNALKNEEIKNKMVQTNIKKYGVKYGWHNGKQIKTWLEKYGVDNPSKAEEIKKKKEETCLKHYGVTNYFKTLKCRINLLSKEAKEKEYKTKIKNKTFNSSKIEDNSYVILKEKYNDVLRQYRDKRYPFSCDFYIPSLDLFIECQYGQFHNGKPYLNNENDKQELEILKEKSIKRKEITGKNKSRYDAVIYTWTDLDVRKRNVAKENNLNYLEFWNINELINWINS